MRNSKWFKIIRDLRAQKSRSFLVLLAMCIGIIGFSMVLSAYVILEREMDKNYLNTTPASASIWTPPMSDETRSLIDSFEGGVAQTETRQKKSLAE